MYWYNAYCQFFQQACTNFMQIYLYSLISTHLFILTTNLHCSMLALVRYCSMLASVQYDYDSHGPIYIHVGPGLMFINVDSSPIQKLGHRTWCQLQGPQQNPKENVSWISNINNFDFDYLHNYSGYSRLKVLDVNGKKNVDCSLGFSFTFYSQNCWY